MKITSVVGARPQFVKLAPIDAAIRDSGHEHTIIHTGQHYDLDMSDSFFDTLSIPAPDIDLHIGSGAHGAQTGAMLARIEDILIETRPDWTVVYGDTNSTLAAALAAVKLDLRIAHVEAGLRSFNRVMPEEHNRVMTDHAADLLLAPSAVAMSHLDREGLTLRARLVGDVMVDVFRLVQERSRLAPRLTIDDATPFHLATIHRQENTDDPDRLRSIVTAIGNVGERVVLAVHPRLRERSHRFGIELETGNIETISPLAYPELVAALGACSSVITDSGGLQKEALLAERPCTTVRYETEWVETLDDGWNVLAPDPSEIAAAVARPTPTANPTHPYGSGDAADRVIAELLDFDPAQGGALC